MNPLRTIEPTIAPDRPESLKPSHFCMKAESDTCLVDKIKTILDTNSILYTCYHFTFNLLYNCEQGTCMFHIYRSGGEYIIELDCRIHDRVYYLIFEEIKRSLTEGILYDFRDELNEDPIEIVIEE
jgi:hypothetical protein